LEFVGLYSCFFLDIDCLSLSFSLPFQVTKALIGVVRKEELKESDHKEMNKHSLKHTSGSAILDDIPELESDDPRVELAISEGQKDTYEARN
jgi:hypothetical protein